MIRISYLFKKLTRPLLAFSLVIAAFSAFAAFTYSADPLCVTPVKYLRTEMPWLGEALQMRESPVSIEYMVSLLMGFLMPAAMLAAGFSFVHRVFVRPIEEKETALALNEPVLKSKVVFSSAAAAFLGLAALQLVLAACTLAARLFVSSWVIEARPLLLLMAGSLCIGCFAAGLGFLAACFSSEMRVGRKGPGVALLLFLVTMAARIKGLWPYAQAIPSVWGLINLQAVAILAWGGLLIAGFVSVAIAAQRFSKRDLPL